MVEIPGFCMASSDDLKNAKKKALKTFNIYLSGNNKSNNPHKTSEK